MMDVRSWRSSSASMMRIRDNLRGSEVAIQSSRPPRALPWRAALDVQRDAHAHEPLECCDAFLYVAGDARRALKQEFDGPHHTLAREPLMTRLGAHALRGESKTCLAVRFAGRDVRAHGQRHLVSHLR